MRTEQQRDQPLKERERRRWPSSGTPGRPLIPRIRAVYSAHHREDEEEDEE